MLVPKEAAYSLVDSALSYVVACWTWFIWGESRDLLKLFIFYSAYELLISVLDDWNIDPEIQVENTLLFDGVAWYEYQPESFSFGSLRICLYDCGKEQPKLKVTECLLCIRYITSIFCSLQQWCEVKTINISVLEMKKKEQTKVQGVGLTCHEPWPQNY